MRITHFIHILLTSSLDQNPLCLSLMGQLLFGTRHECADFRLPSHFFVAYTCRLMTRIHYGHLMPPRRPKILTITLRYMDGVFYGIWTRYTIDVFVFTQLNCTDVLSTCLRVLQASFRKLFKEPSFTTSLAVHFHRTRNMEH